MESQPPDEAPPIRPFNWTWALIVAVWLLLFMIVLAVGAAVVFWRQAASAKYAAAAITAEYQTLNDQLTASDTKVATLTKDRSALVDQLAATNKQIAAANNQASAPVANIAKLTSERDTLSNQLAAADANLAKLTTECDSLVHRLVAAQAIQAGQMPAPIHLPPPAPAPAVANAPGLPPAKAIPVPIPAIPPPGLSEIDRLQWEYKALAAQDPNPQGLDDVASLFEQTGRGGRGINYVAALMGVREHRSLAFVPLVLKYALMEPANDRRGRSQPRNFADAITILTGENADLNAPLDWWLKNKATLTTDFNKMSDLQLRRVVAALIHGNDPFSERSNDDANEVNSKLRSIGYTITDGARGGRGGFCPDDLHPKMLPLLLETVGWSKDPKNQPGPDNIDLPIGVVPLLATLYRAGNAPDLSKIFLDPNQRNSARLACALALHAAGDNLDGKVLLSLAANEKRLGDRVLSITALQFTPTPEVAAKLVEWLGDANDEIVAAAATSLQSNPTPDAVPALRRVIFNPAAKSAVTPAIFALKKIKTAASADALIAYLPTQVRIPSSSFRVNDSLGAFYEITRCPHDDSASPAQRIIDAANWWKANRADFKD